MRCCWSSSVICFLSFGKALTSCSALEDSSPRSESVGVVVSVADGGCSADSGVFEGTMLGQASTALVPMITNRDRCLLEQAGSFQCSF